MTTMKNPSWKIDQLAHRVLNAARWPIREVPSSSLSSSPTPYLDELERALDLHHDLPPLAGSCEDRTNNGSIRRICTLPDSDNLRWSTEEEESFRRDTLQTMIATSGDRNPQKCDLKITTLDEMVPFSPDFYRCLGELVCEAFHPGLVRSLDLNDHRGGAAVDDVAVADDHAHTIAAGHSTDDHYHHSTSHRTLNDKTSSFQGLLSLELYSLPRMMDAVRVTRILLSLQEIVKEDVDGMMDVSFIELLLHYCEGMNIHDIIIGKQQKPPSSNIRNVENDGAIIITTTAATEKKGKRIPILSSLFHHWSCLPQLEHAIQRLSRKYSSLLPTNATQYEEYCKYCTSVTDILHDDSNNNNSRCIGDNGSTGGEWKPLSTSVSSSTSSSSLSSMMNGASFLGDRALRIDSLKMRLENELNCYINGSQVSDKINLKSRASANERGGGLKKLFSMIYQLSNSTLRRKSRRWMGQWLRSFAMGVTGVSSAFVASTPSTDNYHGLDPSFASFCPLIALTSMPMGFAHIPTTDGKPTTLGLGPSSLSHSVGGIGSGGKIPYSNPLGIENTSACGVESLLHVLLCIIRGFRPVDDEKFDNKSGTRRRRSYILRPSHENLLFEVLIPLHKPSGLVLWRDQTPIIGLYHETLVKAIGEFIVMDRMLIGPVIGSLLHPDIWPSTEGGNTPKLVLLLHEIDNLIGLPSKLKEDSQNSPREDKVYLSSLDPYIPSLVSRLCACIASDNSRTSERALQFFRNETFQNLVRQRLLDVGHHFIHALCRCPSREVPWNPTVRKMTLLVLEELEGYYKELSLARNEQNLFHTACENAFLGVDLSLNDNEPNERIAQHVKGTATIETHSMVPTIASNMTSLRASMGSWKPQQRHSISSQQQPPSTVTGVAPWAVAGQAQGSDGKKPPPLEITGVAPWAMKKRPNCVLPSKPSTMPPRMLPRQTNQNDNLSTDTAPAVEVDDNDTNQFDRDHAQYRQSPMGEVRAYMHKLRPHGENKEGADGISSWAKAQMAESPVLLPTLKFHDLVFGQELGTGAFSTVKYARHIQKIGTRSSWPEYAVKIVSTNKIEELGYEKSINREIAILRVLSHPGISRLVSSFRFRDGAYLVLEYASRGDLHTLLRKNGSLDHDSTRFVIGSVAAALWSIHERGFVYADCKPENILITETGHIKVTDFGGCRPVTQDAKTLIKESSKNLLRQLRDGDWKISSFLSGDVAEADDHDDDTRIEGTTAYLPPEVVIGGYPSTAADIWALGCVMFQCISGRPPILEDTDHLTAQKIVAFDLKGEDRDFFGEYDASTFRDDAKSLITRMLLRDSAFRPDVLNIANADFFAGMDIFSLHKKPAHPLDVGAISPTADAKWSRRQFSSIWAPQPRAYNIAAQSSTVGTNGTVLISEGDEADEEFYSGSNATLLTKIRE